MLQALGTQFCMQLLCGFRSPPKCALRTWFFKEVHTPAQLKMQNVHTQRKCKSIRMRTTCEQNANNSPHYAHITHTNYTHTHRTHARKTHATCTTCAWNAFRCVQGVFHDACKMHAKRMQHRQHLYNAKLTPIAYAMRTQRIQHAYNTQANLKNMRATRTPAHMARMQNVYNMALVQHT